MKAWKGRLLAGAALVLALGVGSIASAGIEDVKGEVGRVLRALFGGRIAAAGASSGQVLAWDGTKWAPAAAATGGNETLAQTLALGNTTGANDIVVKNGQKVTSDGSLTLSAAPFSAITLDAPGSLYLHANGAATNADILAFITGEFLPGFDNLVDLGDPSARFKNGYFAGLVSANTVTSAGAITASANTAKSFVYSDASKGLATTSAPSNGELLIGSTSNVPVKATLTAGTGITITNGAGSITIAGDATAPKTVTAKTTSYGLASTDSGKVLTTTSATGTVIFTLPTWASGLTYTLCSDAAQIMTVTAPGSDVIRYGDSVTAGGGSLSTTTSGRGHSITLVATASGAWTVVAITGSTWN